MEKITSRGVADSGRHSRFIGDWGGAVPIPNVNKLSHIHLCTSVTNGGEYGWPAGTQSGENVLTPCTVTCHSTEATPHRPWHGSRAKSNSASTSSPSLTWAFHLTQLVAPWSLGFSRWSPCQWPLLALCRWPPHIPELCIQSTPQLHPRTPPLLYLSSFSRTSVRLMALKTSLMLVAPKFETPAWNVPLKSPGQMASIYHCNFKTVSRYSEVFRYKSFPNLCSHT